MDRGTVMKLVVREVEKVQEISGREKGEIDIHTTPIGDATGFDSLNGIEVTVALSECLDHEFSDNNLFVSQSGRRALSIDEITDNICKAVGAEIGTK